MTSRTSSSGTSASSPDRPLQPGFEAFRKIWGKWPDPPAITVAIAIGLARREFLVEVDAVAEVAE